MKIKLSSGVILESNDEQVCQQLLKHGGKEVKETKKSKKTSDE